MQSNTFGACLPRISSIWTMCMSGGLRVAHSNRSLFNSIGKYSFVNNVLPTEHFWSANKIYIVRYFLLVKPSLWFCCCYKKDRRGLSNSSRIFEFLYLQFVSRENDVVTLNATFRHEQRQLIVSRRARAKTIDMQFFKYSIDLSILIVLCGLPGVTYGKWCVYLWYISAQMKMCHLFYLMIHLDCASVLISIYVIILIFLKPNEHRAWCLSYGVFIFI